MTARKKLIYKFIHAFMAAFLVGVMFYSVLDFCNIVPFGDNNRILFDMKRQYVDFYSYYRTIITGENNILYSQELSLGAGAVSFFTYYLSSPFMLLVFLFDNTHLPEAVNNMVGMKLVLSAFNIDLFFQHYLEKDDKSGRFKATMVFSLCYAFSAYLLSNSTNPMWMDVFLMMPIVIWMLDRLIKDNKKAGYILSLTYIVYCNYYISFMVCIFIVMWTLFRLYGEKKSSFKEAVNILGRVFVCSVIAVAMDSWFLFTTVSELFNSPKDITQLGLEANAKHFSLTEIYSKIYALTYDKLQTYFGTPLIYAGVAVIMLTLLYFMNTKIKLREKICMAVMLLIFVISYQVDVINLVWHGGMEPSGYPFRETFLYVFLILICSCNCLNRFNDGINIPKILITGAVTLGFFAYVLTKKYNFADKRMIMMNLVLIVSYTIVLIMIRLDSKRKILIYAGIGLLTAISVIELTDNAKILYSIQGTWHRDDNSYFVKMVEDTTPAVEAIKADKSFYRVENATPREKNDAMMYDYHAITHYSSSGTLSTRNILNCMGYRDDGLFTDYGHNNTVLADSLLGVKYLMTSEDIEHSDYIPIYENEVSAYRNPYALSVANMAKATDNDIDGNPFEVQEKMLGIILGEKCKVFVPAKVEKSVQTEEGQTKVNYTATADCDGNMYFYIDGIKDKKINMELFLGEESLGEYGPKSTIQILNLGEYKKGETITLTGVLSEGDVSEEDVIFVTEDKNSLSAYCEKAMEQSAQIEEISSSRLAITLPEKYDNGEFKGVMLTVPYYQGWRIENSDIRPTKCAEYLMYIPIEAFSDGEAVINYIPAGWYAGIVTSAVAFIGMIVLILCSAKKERHEEIKNII